MDRGNTYIRNKHQITRKIFMFFIPSLLADLSADFWTNLMPTHSKRLNLNIAVIKYISIHRYYMQRDNLLIYFPPAAAYLFATSFQFATWDTKRKKVTLHILCII